VSSLVTWKDCVPSRPEENPAVPGARAAYIDPSTTTPEERKKEEVVVLLPRELTV